MLRKSSRGHKEKPQASVHMERTEIETERIWYILLMLFKSQGEIEAWMIWCRFHRIECHCKGHIFKARYHIKTVITLATGDGMCLD